jgi:DNA-binding SARP family transcriptional activator
MARLSIHLLGPFQVTLHRAPVTDFPSDKVRALLAYLSAEADRPHRRESLAGLLWPDYPEERARGSLRTALASLRMLIGDRQAMPPALHVTRQTVQFNRDSDAWTDVTTFAQLVGPALPAAAGDQPMQRLEEAIGLFRGSFLEGFSLPDSPPFEEWALLTREQLQRQALEALHHLTTHHERQGEIARALEYARRSVELDPFRGATQRQLMRLLALSGQRESALAQYGSYRQLLHAELGVEPSPATQGLHDLLANRQWPPGAPDAASLERELRKTGPSPYRGLAAFQQEDAQFFFGRAAFVQRLVGAVAQDPAVTVVVGPSGCGKSSTIFAGLLPRLVAADEEQWLIVALRPGDRPNHSLAAALMSALEPGPGGEAGPTTAQHEAHGRQGADSTLPRLGEQLDREIPGATRLLLVVDQFEELYTLCPDPEARRHFLDQLLAPSRRGSPAPALRVSLLLALRADFMAQVLTHRPFADALQDATLILGPMDREELRAAIAKPAEVQGAAFEAGLVERMLDDVGEAPGNLPMLEFALTLLWEHQDRGWLTHAAYEAIGQVEGALARFADEVYSGMDPGEETRVRQIFLQLVQPGEGTEDTRRLATRAEVGEGNWGLVQHLADHRLVVTGLDAAGREVVELAHEALIEAWGQLRAWLEEDRAFRTWQEGLRTAIRSWVASCRDEGALLRGAPLAAAEGWLSERDGDLSDAERTFIRASARHRDQREAEREALRRRELEAARRLTEAESRRAQVLQRGAMVLAGILLVVLMLAAAAILAREEATRNERLATARELAAAALNNLDVDPERSALLALQAVEETYAPDKVALPEAVNALHQAVGALRLQLAVASEESLMRFVAFSPDGTRLVTWGLTDWDALPGRTRVWDANSGELTLTLPGIRAAQSWPDGQRLATVLLGESGATHTLWDSRSGEALASAGFSPAAVPTDGDYDPEWRRTATGLLDGRVQVHDLATGQALITLGVEGSPPGLAFVFSPDGERLAAGREDGSVIVWDLDSGDSPPM